jgi:ubiquinone/menaquinone biosynthesis C-methylase UbiE
MVAAATPEQRRQAVASSRPPNEPEDAHAFTRKWDRAYTAFARPYDLAVRLLPVWKSWLRRALPHIAGPRVLEVSFGTGYLISRYAGAFQTHGLDYNRKMVTVARKNLARAGSRAQLVRGNVEALPYPDASFDSLVNTMAFSGYPNGERALAEMKRVLRDDGRLVLIDFTYPPDGNRLGSRVAALWERSGDVLRDMPALFRDCGLDYTDESIGAWGSVRLYVATKAAQAASGGGVPASRRPGASPG